MSASLACDDRVCDRAERLFHTPQQAGSSVFLLRAAEQAPGDCVFHQPPSLIRLTLAGSVCGFSEVYDSPLLS